MEGSMARRILLVVLALCASSWGLRAAERATFILADGQRVSGTLDPHGNASGSELSLAVGAGEIQTFDFGEVAVIDFAGGSPKASELAALPSSGHMLAMRNGGLRMGRMAGIVNGDTVVWEEEGGARRNIRVRQIARVYLDPDSARYTYRYSGPRPGDRQGYGSRRSAQPLVSEVVVPGDQPWTDTGVDVIRGDVLRFDDQGGITFITGPNNAANAGGKAQIKSDKYPVPSAGVGALIGKVGIDGTPFLVGAGNRPVAMPASGRLWLGVNDDNFSDNSGAFRVTIR
jgi:hypothetical protein